MSARRQSLPARTLRWFTATGWRHLVGLAIIAFAVMPLLYVLSASFNKSGTLTGSNALFSSISLHSYENLFTDPNTPFGTWWLNTMKVAGVSTIGTVTLTTLAAYAFSRLRFRGRRAALITIVLVQMVPSMLSVVAVFLLIFNLGALFPFIGLDTHAGLILIYLGGSLGMITYLMYGNFNTIPREIDEAARIDGASHVRIFLQILVPLSVPIIAVVSLLVFLSTVGEYAIAQVLLVQPDVKTAAVGLTQFVQNAGQTGTRDIYWGLFTAGSILLALPVLVLFLLLQRYIVSGLTAGSLK
jgi:arabinogalactan oligomer / maltooligosaccharide transport system permease protein